MWVSAQFGALLHKQDSNDPKTSPPYGVSGGAWFTNRWGVDVRFELSKTDSEWQSTTDPVTQRAGTADNRYFEAYDREITGMNGH